jgi:archaellum component FlaG (FlaF/FlaG flagellin family)
MGFSLTGAHIVFFVAAVIVAGTVSGVFIAVTINVTSSLSEKGERISEQLDTEFKIINDPKNIPLQSGYYLFYLKNVGNKKITTTNETFQIFIDGDLISTTNYYFSNNSIAPSDHTMISIAQSLLNSGYHKIRLIGPYSVNDEFIFEI